MKKLIKASLLSVVLFGGTIATSSFLLQTVNEVEKIQKINAQTTLAGTREVTLESSDIPTDTLVDGFYLFPTGGTWGRADKLSYEERWYLWNEPTIKDETKETYTLNLSYVANTDSSEYDSSGKEKYVGMFSPSDEGNDPMWDETIGLQNESPLQNNNTSITNEVDGVSYYSAQVLTGVAVNLKETTKEGETKDVWFTDDTHFLMTESGLSIDIPNLNSSSSYEIVDVFFQYTTKNNDGSAWGRATYPNDLGQLEYWDPAGENTGTILPGRSGFDYAPVIDADSFEWDGNYDTEGTSTFKIDITSGTGDLNYENLTDVTLTADEYEWDGSTISSANKELEIIDDVHDVRADNSVVEHTFTVGGLDKHKKYNNLTYSSNLNFEGNELLDSAWADEAVAPMATFTDEQFLFSVDAREFYDYSPVINEESFIWDDSHKNKGEAKFSFEVTDGTGELVWANLTDVTLTADEYDINGNLVSNDSNLEFTEEITGTTHTFTITGLEDGHSFNNLEFSSNLDIEGNEISSTIWVDEVSAPTATFLSEEFLFQADDRSFYDYPPVIDETSFVWNSEYQTQGKAQFNIDITSGTGALTYKNLTDIQLKADEFDKNGAYKGETTLTFNDNYDASINDNSYVTHTFTVEGLTGGYKYDNLQFTSTLENIETNDLTSSSWADEAVAPEALVTSTDLGTEYLFEAPMFSKPIINSSFMFTDINPESAVFSFDIYYTTEEPASATEPVAFKTKSDEGAESFGSEEFYWFTPSKDVHLLQGTETEVTETEGTETEKVVTFNNKDEYEIEFIGHEDVTSTEGEDTDGSTYTTYTLFYEVSGLTPNTDYSNFGIFIDARDGEAEDSSPVSGTFESMNEPTLANDSEYLTLYSITPFRGTFKTPHQIIFYIIVIVILLLILLAIGLVALVVYGLMWWHKHISMAIYIDAEDSHATGDLILNLVHAQRHPEIWHAHEEDLILYAEGREIDAVFRRDHTVKGGFKVFVTEDGQDGRHSFVAIMQAEKYDNFTIGVDEREWHAFAISDKKAKQIAKAHEKKAKNIYYDIRKEVLNEMDKTYSKSASTSEHGVIAHISHKKSREDKIRFQLILPKEGHPLTDEFDPTSDKLIFYHLYDGQLYKLDHNYIGTYGSMIEWDFINLRPGSIYVGISFSIDGGKTIYPSSAVYGITADEEGHIHSKTDAILAAPIKPTLKGVKIWKRSDAIEYLGDDAFDSLCAIVVKKHYEKDNPDVFLVADRAQEYYDEYIDLWLSEAEKKTTTTKKSTTTKKTTTTKKSTTTKKATTTKSK